ncbi:glutathione ABC transporter substrate-binding protein GsiB [Paeniglutamicibacter psychrophenolicus]|uniref:Peptide/nickel transport system substrate-binding protein n=1 Tax=Paeniglutamicibacter psychrophenolicus TaxID=257454 RepID=A0ABS4W9Q6_9MICC|nr:ABC transporter substrate-binding protein [Paeniglutamicibacter psychrophenolicus]MBP2372925.1 peptide/nickel transport system substrate-binding protein [Paeniglutamicibacter psychrophenolicus]
MRTKPLKVALAAGAVLALASCSASPGATGDGAPAPAYEITANTAAPVGELDKLTFSTYAEPFSLDYAYAFDYADNQVLANVCESLVRLNDDMSISPGLAEKYENRTPNTWVYTIRQGVKFHDGTTLTADDVVASMNRHLDPAVGSFWYSVYQNVEKIEKTGPNEVTVTSKVPDALFNESMSGAAGVIDSAAMFKKAGADYGNAKGGVNCTGPFEFKSWQSGEKLSFDRFDGYWDPDLKAKAKELDFVIMTDPVARVNALKSGEIDGGWVLPATAVDDLNASGAGKVYFGLNTAVQSLVVSNPDGPLGKPEVRKALLMALDRDGLVKAAEGGYGKRTNSLTSESVWKHADDGTKEAAFKDLVDYPYDVEAAAKIVKEQGVEGQEITITTAPIGNNFAVIAQATAAAAESIGLKAKINTVTPNAYTALFSDPEARKGTDLYYTSWYLSVGDPQEMFSILRTGDFSNYGDWSNKAFDTSVNAALETMDQQERFTKSLEAQKITNAEIPWLPLYESPNLLWMSNKITGASPSINFMYYPWAAKIGAAK